MQFYSEEVMTMMTGKEKVYFLLNRIEDKRVLTPKGQPILIHPASDLSNNYSIVELSQLFAKLEKDEQILKVLKESARGLSASLDPYADFEDGCYHLEVLPRFDEYFAKIRLEPEYQESSGKRPANQSKLTSSDESKQDTQPKDVPNVVYEITYTGSREILLNKLLLISKPDFNSENDLFFSFLYENPNKTFKVSEIEAKIGTLTKDIHKILENLGFTGDIRKVFINASRTSVCFSNPITRSDLEKLGINIIKLPR